MLPIRDYSFIPCPKCGERLHALPTWGGIPLWKCEGCGVIFNIGVVYWGDKALSLVTSGGVRVMKDNRELDPSSTLDLFVHSEEFNWGYDGSGPAQLALALLLDTVGEREALELAVYFKEEVVACLPEHFELPQSDIRAWVEAQKVRVLCLGEAI